MKLKKAIYLVILVSMSMSCRGVLAEEPYAVSSNESRAGLIVSESPDVDVVLSVGSSKLDISNFEQELKEELQSRNMDVSKVNIKTFDTVEISSEAQDAYKIFTSWTSFPFHSPIYWTYNSTNKWLTTGYNEAYETGFIDQTSGKVKDFKMKTTVQGPETNQPLGFVFRVTQSEKYPGKWDMYYLWTSTDLWSGGGNEKVFAIFKVEGQNLDASTRPNWGGTYSATPLMRYAGNYFGWPYHRPYDYGGYPHGTPYKEGITVTNKADPNLKTTTLAVGSIPFINGNTWYTLGVDIQGNHFSATVNGQEVLETTDEENPYTEGYYGIFSYSHINPKFKEVLIQQQQYKTFSEAVNESEWREGAARFIINLNDKKEVSFTDEVIMGGLLNQTKAQNIHYISWGNSLNKEENVGFITQNKEEGIVIDNTNYHNSILEIADYITFNSIFPEGAGTKENPYKISSAQQLFNMKHKLNAYYELSTDIDLEGQTWTPIGTYEAAFTGHFDGNGKTISNFTIEGSDTDYLGFFGVTDHATIQNVTIDRVSISGRDYIGALIGYVRGKDTVITNCHVGEGTIKGYSYVGGLIGKMEYGMIETCESLVGVEGNLYIGGLIGYGYGMIIKDCTSLATVTGNEDVGGLIGFSNGNIIETCEGIATVVGHKNVGGLAGHSSGLTLAEIGFTPMIDTCNSLGNIKGSSRIGGLVGYASYDRIEGCTTSDNVEGDENVGGLVGYSEASSINECSSEALIEGNTNIGDLVGYEE